jgi:hypothetical protein
MPRHGSSQCELTAAGRQAAQIAGIRGPHVALLVAGIRHSLLSTKWSRRQLLAKLAPLTAESEFEHGRINDCLTTNRCVQASGQLVVKMARNPGTQRLRVPVSSSALGVEHGGFEPPTRRDRALVDELHRTVSMTTRQSGAVRNQWHTWSEHGDNRRDDERSATRHPAALTM